MEISEYGCRKNTEDKLMSSERDRQRQRKSNQRELNEIQKLKREGRYDLMWPWNL